MFLTEVAVGGYAPAREILAAAAGEGISKTTLHRARKRARIRSTKAGFGGGWVWVLPTQDSSEGSEDSTFQNPESSEPSAESSGQTRAGEMSICATCGQPMKVIEDGQTVHPMC
jgi:hypothetical protein